MGGFTSCSACTAQAERLWAVSPSWEPRHAPQIFVFLAPLRKWEEKKISSARLENMSRKRFNNPLMTGHEQEAAWGSNAIS